MTIDSLNKWQSFCMTDIFVMRNTKSIVQRDIVPDSGDTPYVTASVFNNGVLTYIDCPPAWIDAGNCIMIGGKTMTFSYQAADFCSNDSHNIALYLKNIKHATELVYLYLISVLRSLFEQRYSWTDSISMKRIKNEDILLPVDSRGNPDWDYMGEYMSSIITEAEDSLDCLMRIDGKKQSVDIAGWKKFHLYDEGLFDIDMGTKFDKIKMTEFCPSVNFVGRGNANNGITAFVDEVKGVKPYSSGYLSLSLGGDVGSCFVQPERFYTSQNVVVLIPKWDMPDAVKWFIAAVIFRESHMYYRAFVDELNRHIKTDFSFYLPVTADGVPDWGYMESYMQKIVVESKKHLKSIAQVLA